jgi:hypothetical protein
MLANGAPMVAAQAAPADAPQRLAEATFQPAKVRAQALANFTQRFDASSQKTVGGHPLSAAQQAMVAKVKKAGLAELGRQLNADAIPTALAAIQADYRNNFTPAELEEIAAFWTSPAGLALTGAFQSAVSSGSGVIAPPPEHREAITRYFASSVGQKEASRRSEAQQRLNQIMSQALARAQAKTNSAMDAALAAAQPKQQVK